MSIFFTELIVLMAAIHAGITVLPQTEWLCQHKNWASSERVLELACHSWAGLRESEASLRLMGVLVCPQGSVGSMFVLR